MHVDEMLVREADRARIAVEIEQADRIDVPAARQARSQSTWSVRLYQVKPTSGTPALRSSWTLCHCRQSQRGASAASTRSVSVCIRVRR